MGSNIKIIEVGLRDGLQVVNTFIPTEEKLNIIDDLIDAGIKNIQVTSFVNPKKIPQMSDAELVVKQLPNINGIEYSALVFNTIGVERAIRSGIKKIETSISVSQAYNQKNLGMDLSKSVENLKQIIQLGIETKLKIRAGLQCVWGCPFDGNVGQKVILKKLSDILEMGINRISLCDTSGMATPDSTAALLEAINKTFPDIILCMHFHNTYGMGLANLYKALEYGIQEIDTSIGGIGGSPYINGSKGNIATEDTLYMLNSMGYKTNIDMKKVIRLSKKLKERIGLSYFNG